MAKKARKLEEGICTCPACEDIFTFCVYNRKTLQLAVICYHCGYINIVVKRQH